MTDDPPASLLIAEVRKALEVGLAPGFAQKVAANALGIAQRELERGPPATGEDLVRWSEAASSGEPQLDDLIQLAVAKLRIDQPTYPPFRHWQETGG